MVKVITVRLEQEIKDGMLAAAVEKLRQKDDSQTLNKFCVEAIVNRAAEVLGITSPLATSTPEVSNGD